MLISIGRFGPPLPFSMTPKRLVAIIVFADRHGLIDRLNCLSVAFFFCFVLFSQAKEPKNRCTKYKKNSITYRKSHVSYPNNYFCLLRKLVPLNKRNLVTCIWNKFQKLCEIWETRKPFFASFLFTRKRMEKLEH